jgi:putative ABC transport system permease protein
MFQNYLLTALRNLRKNLTFSIINIFGLGLGLTVTLMLAAWVTDELSYDQFHDRATNIYRVSVEYGSGGQVSKTSVSPTALLPSVMKNFEEVETGVRVYNPSSYSPFIVKHEDKLFNEDHFYFADSTFFDIFSYRLLKGNPDNALREPASVIVSEAMAEKYFGQDDPIGRVLNVNNNREYTVTGVIENAPSNSYLKYDFIGSFASLRQATEENVWWSANYQTFILVNPQADMVQLEAKTNALVRKAIGSELPSPGDYVQYNWTRLTDLHLRSTANGEMETVSSIQYVYLFSGIGLLVLLIACINYVNLSTARAADRAKEVGVRKVVGAGKPELILQFIGESITITVLAFALALGAALLLLPAFNAVADKTLSTALFFQPTFLMSSFAVVLAIGVFSGIYPALAITAFRPVSILKGNFKTSGRGVLLRQTLVVFQFCISVVLIVGTIAIVNQLNFLSHARLGYDKENVFVLPLDRSTEKVYDQLRNEFLRTGAVQDVGRATESPTVIKGGYTIQVQSNSESKPMLTTAISIDENFISAMNMELVRGVPVTEADMARAEKDTVFSFILNQSAIREMMLNEETAIGTHVMLNGRQGEIKGVVRDFHFASLHQKIGPLVMFNQPDQYNYIFVKLKPGNVKDGLNKLAEVCRAVIPHRPFEYEFVDEQYASLYQAEQKTGVLATLFATLAILIASMGLLGLVAFATAQRMKEIGIRKVLGATVPNIVIMITQDYSKLVLLAIGLGFPLSYWIVNSWWLNNFAYKTEIGIGSFALAAAACLVIAFGAAGYQAMKAAVIDPSKTLRNE